MPFRFGAVILDAVIGRLGWRLMASLGAVFHHCVGALESLMLRPEARPFSTQLSTMATRWLYTPDGKPAYYLEGKWLCSYPDTKPTFYIEENWVYTREGKPTFWIRDNWLYEHPAGQKSLYFG